MLADATAMYVYEEQELVSDRMTTKEKSTFQPVFADLALPVLTAYGSLVSRAGKSPEKDVVVAFSDFQREPFPDEKCKLPYYGLPDIAPTTQAANWPCLLMAALAIAALSLLLVRRMRLRQG